MGEGSAGLGAQASLDPPLSAFGARGKKAQRIAAAHDPHLSLQPPERALRPRAAALPSLGTRVLVYCGGGELRGTGREPSGQERVGGAVGQRAPDMEGHRLGRAAAPFWDPSATRRPRPEPPQVPSGQSQGESHPFQGPLLCAELLRRLL